MPPDIPPSAFRLEPFQRHLAELLSGLEHPPLGAGVALAEECGEVNKHLLDHHAYGRPLAQDKLAAELIDVLICVCEIATAHHIDIDTAAQSKLADLERRIPDWRAELSEPLRKARMRPIY